MQRNYHHILQIISILPILVGGRFLSALGKSNQAMRMISRHINSHRWKTRSFAGYEPTSQDVFVATFAKSGTNWMMQIAQQTAYYGAAEFNHIHDLVPWPDVPFPEIRARLNDTTIAQRSPSGLRIIKTHYEHEYIPFNNHAKYITVIRDPKEVIVSSYYFGRILFDPLGVRYDLNEWLAAAMEPENFLFGDWAVHTAGWWAMRNLPNVLVITYRDLKRNMIKIINQVAELMEVNLTPDQIEIIIQRASFDWMKANESHFYAITLPQRTKKDLPPMLRSGKSGKSSELLTYQQQVAIDQYFKKRLDLLKSDLPYSEMFQ